MASKQGKYPGMHPELLKSKSNISKSVKKRRRKRFQRSQSLYKTTLTKNLFKHKAESLIQAFRKHGSFTVFDKLEVLFSKIGPLEMKLIMKENNRKLYPERKLTMFERKKIVLGNHIAHVFKCYRKKNMDCSIPGCRALRIIIEHVKIAQGENGDRRKCGCHACCCIMNICIKHHSLCSENKCSVPLCREYKLKLSPEQDKILLNKLWTIVREYLWKGKSHLLKKEKSVADG